MVAPKIRFLTKIYHPNIDKLGRICMDTLKGIIRSLLIIGVLTWKQEIGLLHCKFGLFFSQFRPSSVPLIQMVSYPQSSSAVT